MSLPLDATFLFFKFYRNSTVPQLSKAASTPSLNLVYRTILIPSKFYKNVFVISKNHIAISLLNSHFRLYVLSSFFNLESYVHFIINF